MIWRKSVQINSLNTWKPAKRKLRMFPKTKWSLLSQLVKRRIQCLAKGLGQLIFKSNWALFQTSSRLLKRRWLLGICLRTLERTRSAQLINLWKEVKVIQSKWLCQTYFDHKLCSRGAKAPRVSNLKSCVLSHNGKNKSKKKQPLATSKDFSSYKGLNTESARSKESSKNLTNVPSKLLS